MQTYYCIRTPGGQSLFHSDFVHALIAIYGKKVREGKQDDKPVAITKENILSTFIPRGNYFTVHQAARTCGTTSKQIRALNRKGKLEALGLPGLGIIIEAEKLHQFLYKKALDVQMN